MKFFTMDWWLNALRLTRLEVERPFFEYDRHLEALGPRLPAACRELAPIERLHDARIVFIDQRTDGHVVLKVATAEEDGSSRELTLAYCGVLGVQWMRGGADDSTVGTPVLSDLGDLGYHEFDVDDQADGTYVHRMLFATGWELEVRFGDMNLST